MKSSWIYVLFAIMIVDPECQADVIITGTEKKKVMFDGHTLTIEIKTKDTEPYNIFELNRFMHVGGAKIHIITLKRPDRLSFNGDYDNGVKLSDSPKLIISANKIEILDGKGRKHGEIHKEIQFGKYGNRNSIMIGLGELGWEDVPNFYTLIVKNAQICPEQQKTSDVGVISETLASIFISQR